MSEFFFSCFHRYDDPGMQRCIASVCLKSRRLERCYSSASPMFTSFFYHNAQWKSRFQKSLPSPLRGVMGPTGLQAVQPVFREIENLTPMRLLRVYEQLSKSRLTILVVLSAMSSVAMSPYPTPLPVLLSTALGTVLCSASANTLNQIQEVPFDAQMARTRNRPLVRRAITPTHAVGFALFTGITGPALLWTMVNPTTACLGLANIALYSGVYTWMKRRSVANTWVGSVVGAIPPLMGWTACGGHILPMSTSLNLFWPPFITENVTVPLDLSLIDNPLSALALFTLLYSWQFPHFNSLSYMVRESYALASYQMLAVFSPKQNALVSFRHSVALAVVCSVLIPISGLTTWAFSVTSLLPNAVLVSAAHKYWKHGGEKEARILWKHSLWYLPAILGLMMFHKQGMDWIAWIGLAEEKENSEIIANGNIPRAQVESM